MTCLGRRDDIYRYVDEDLNQEERAELEAHLAACHTCQTELEAAKAVFAVLTELRDVPVPTGIRDAVLAGLPEPRGARVLRWVLAAQALATIVLLLLIYPTLAGWHAGLYEWLLHMWAAAPVSAWAVAGIELWHDLSGVALATGRALLARGGSLSWPQAAVVLALCIGSCLAANLVLLRNGHKGIGGMT